MNQWRMLLPALAIAVVAAPSFARGSGEEIPPEDSESAVPPQETEAAVDPELLDEATASILFDLGVMPFENRIPSEDFTLALLSGGEVSLSDYRGKVVFLNFWATWCPPCREEMPSMQVLYDTLAEDGLEVVAVNVLEAEDIVSTFVEENQFSYPVLLDRDGRVSLRYAIRAYPTTYILDRESNVIAVRPGYHDWSTPEMVAGFRQLLAQ